MFKKIEKKHDNLNFYNLNQLSLLLSVVLFSLTCYYLNNIFLLIIIYILIFDLYLNVSNKIISFFTYFIGILNLIYILFLLTNFSLIPHFNNYYFIFIKFLLLVDYIIIVIKILENENNKNIKKKYTFKELRKRKYNNLKEKNRKLIGEYLKEEDINLASDYAKVINDNIDDLTNNSMENYIYLEYLRFYKNKNSKNGLLVDKFNLIYLVIHVIILVLILLVR